MTDKAKSSSMPRRIATAFTVGIIATILIVVGAAWALQGRILYGSPWGHQPAAAGWTEVKLKVEGSGDLSAYSRPARKGMPTVLFLHGSGYGYADSMKALKSFTDAGMGALIAEYPGYGGNPGSLTEESAKRTAVQAREWLVRSGVAPGSLVIYGEGFGAGAAIAAAQKPNKRLLIVSGISDMPALVRSRYRFVPDFLIADKWNVAPDLVHVKSQVTVVHAPKDEFVPVAQGEAFAKASKTSLVIIPGGNRIAFNEGLQSALVASILR